MNTPTSSTIQKPFSACDRQVGRHPLDSIFVPKSVAVVGATEKVGSVGRTVLWNLMNTPFGGPIYPVNPTRPSVLGIKAYPKLASLPEKPDLVVVTTPAAIIPGHHRRSGRPGHSRRGRHLRGLQGNRPGGR